MTCNVSQDATPEDVAAALKREGLGELVGRPHGHPHYLEQRRSAHPYE